MIQAATWIKFYFPGNPVEIDKTFPYTVHKNHVFPHLTTLFIGLSAGLTLLAGWLMVKIAQAKEQEKG